MPPSQAFCSSKLTSCPLLPAPCSLKPLKPLKPLKSLKPLKPLKSLKLNFHKQIQLSEELCVLIIPLQRIKAH